MTSFTLCVDSLYHSDVVMYEYHSGAHLCNTSSAG